MTLERQNSNFKNTQVAFSSLVSTSVSLLLYIALPTKKPHIEVTEMVREEEKSRWWWFESHKSSNRSQWLHSTLAELDAKTNSMLKLIEGNADSFAQRAETYYKKRPELITIVEDFYRAHRSLAERFDHLKSSDNRSSKLHHQDTMESFCDSNSPTISDADSEIEDPNEVEKDKEAINKDLEVLNCKQDETWKLEQEKLKLIQETDALRRQLLEKDEEKREVIRQLALTVETLKEDNLRLKRCLDDESPKKRSSVFEFKPIDKFIGKLFYIMCEGNNR